MDATTHGTLLGGRVPYEQPVAGYRTGIEPVFLAAAVPARPGQRVLEGGTGAGAALLCLAARVPGLVAVGVERDPGMAEIAARNVARHPGLSVRPGAIEALDDVAAFDHACANPPWHDPAGTAPPDPVRRAALHARPDMIQAWCRALHRHLRPGGTVTLVLPARLAAVGRDGLHGAGSRGVKLRPLLPRVGRAPRIVILHGTAEPGDPDLPGLVLHPEANGYTDAAEAILRGGAALGWDG